MTDQDLARTQAQLAQIALLSLELADLDTFIERTAGLPEAALHRDLAVAVAAVQRVAHAQLGSDAT